MAAISTFPLGVLDINRNMTLEGRATGLLQIAAELANQGAHQSSKMLHQEITFEDEDFTPISVKPTVSPTVLTYLWSSFTIACSCALIYNMREPVSFAENLKEAWNFILNLIMNFILNYILSFCCVRCCLNKTLRLMMRVAHYFQDLTIRFSSYIITSIMGYIKDFVELLLYAVFCGTRIILYGIRISCLSPVFLKQLVFECHHIFKCDHEPLEDCRQSSRQLNPKRQLLEIEYSQNANNAGVSAELPYGGSRCRFCGRVEGESDDFVTCAKCIKDESRRDQEMMVYCSRVCCKMDWRERHKEEHNIEAGLKMAIQ